MLSGVESDWLAGVGGEDETILPDRLPPDLAAADDAALAALAATDRRAFGLLYDRYVDRIYRYCYRRLRDIQAAEDATAQVFLKAMQALASYREGGAFAGWLFAIAHSVTIDIARRQRPTAPLDAVGDRSAPDPSPERLVIAAEERSEFRALLLSLPADQRQAMEYRLAGLTGLEVAEAMGKTHDAVKMLQFRAIQTLRRLLGAGHGAAERRGR